MRTEGNAVLFRLGEALSGAAAGFTVPTEKIDEMRQALYAKTLELHPGGEFPERPLWIDAELPFEEVTGESLLCLDALEPYGQGNEAPVFISRDLRLAEPPSAAAVPIPAPTRRSSELTGRRLLEPSA